MKTFSRAGTVVNLDLAENTNAQYNYVLEDSADTLSSVEGLSNFFEGEDMKFDGIMVTAGGWNGKKLNISFL